MLDVLKENKKKIIILIIVLLLCVFISIVLNGSPDKKIIKYFKNIGFYNDNNGILYYKQVSDIDENVFNNNVSNNIDSNYEKFIFDISNYELLDINMEYDDGVLSDFSGTYNYATNSVDYNYRVTYNNTNIIVNGKYEEDDFSCNYTFVHDFDIDKSSDVICENAKSYCESFSFEARNLIKNNKILDYLKK